MFNMPVSGKLPRVSGQTIICSPTPEGVRSGLQSGSHYHRHCTGKVAAVPPVTDPQYHAGRGARPIRLRIARQTGVLHVGNRNVSDSVLVSMGYI